MNRALPLGQLKRLWIVWDVLHSEIVFSEGRYISLIASSLALVDARVTWRTESNETVRAQNFDKRAPYSKDRSLL